VVLEVVLIAKTMGLQVSESAVVEPVQGAIVAGLQTAVLVVVLIVKMMGLQVSESVVEVQAQAGAQQEPHVIGIAAVEHAEVSGKLHARTQVVNSPGALRSACLTTQLQERSVILLVQLFLRQQLQEILSGKMGLAVASVTC